MLEPTKRVIASLLCLDERGAIVLVKPIYREPWLLPGGVVEADESPAAACAREAREELGLALAPAALLCVDHRAPTARRPATLHLLFSGGVLSDAQLAAITLPPDELAAFQCAPPPLAARLLPPKGALLLAHGLDALHTGRTLYLEEASADMQRISG